MTPRSRSQILRALHTWGVGGVEHFDLGAFDHETDTMSLHGAWIVDQMMHATGWLATRNSGWTGEDCPHEPGASIYAHPARALEVHPWIVVDALDEDGIEHLDAIATARGLADRVVGEVAAGGGSQFGHHKLEPDPSASLASP